MATKKNNNAVVAGKLGKELIALNALRIKLKEFLDQPNCRGLIGFKQEQLLKKQAKAMATYAECLEKRKALLEKAV